MSMYEILYNFSWMGFNIFLAVLGVIFAQLMLKAKSKTSKIGFGILWLLFLPNTIYIVTDIIHLAESLSKTNGIYQIIVVIQYIILEIVGLLSFFYSLSPFEKILHKKFPKHPTAILNSIVVFNFVIAFGLVLGRVQRTNSWDVFTNMNRVLNDSLHTFSSAELMLYTFLFGLLGNIVYFSLKQFLK